MVRKDLERIGIPYETEEGIADFHAAGRASHITEMLRSGADLVQVMKQARHSDVKMTLRYFKGNLSDQQQAVSKLPMPADLSQYIVSTVCGVSGQNGASPGASWHGTPTRSHVTTSTSDVTSGNEKHDTASPGKSRKKRRGGDSLNALTTFSFATLN
jgi:hypothetical protein